MPNSKMKYDFRAFGQAIKNARNKQGMTRNQAAELIGIDPRYLTNIENKGQHPSLNVFNIIVTLFNLSVDQFFFAGKEPLKSTRRRRLDGLLDSLSDNELLIVEATAYGIIQSKEPGSA